MTKNGRNNVREQTEWGRKMGSLAALIQSSLFLFKFLSASHSATLQSGRRGDEVQGATG